MKTMRKIFALALAVMMVMSLATNAFADEVETYTITINNAVDGHTYEAYQILVGDLYIETDEEGNVTKTLSNVQWGANANQTGDVAEEILENLTIANAADYVNFASTPVGTSTDAGDTYVIEGLAPGYYLVKDQDDSLDGKDDAYTSYILEVVEDSIIKPKSSKPDVDKQVWDEAEDAETVGTNWGETADHEINESFQFKLIATLAADPNYAAYETYKLVFTDTMSDGVTFESIASVTVSGTPITDYTCTATAGHAGGSWTLTIADIKQYDADLTDGCVVEVIYNAHLNENAVIGNPGNPNTVGLEYSNNPNWDGEGEEDTGKTPEDTVWVFTYELDVTKVDDSEAKAALKDAEFQMKNAEGKWLVVDENDKVQKWTDDKAEASTLKSDENGLFKVIGLDHGTYTLIETKAPAGYNLLTAPIEVVISATHSENAEGASASIKTLTITVDNGEAANGNLDTGVVEMDVVNKAGATLPETGGIGTTIFYAVGGLMVLAAVVLLVTKRRMNMAE